MYPRQGGGAEKEVQSDVRRENEPKQERSQGDNNEMIGKGRQKESVWGKGCV